MKIKFCIDPEFSPALAFAMVRAGDDMLLFIKNPARVAGMPTWLQEHVLNLLAEQAGNPPHLTVEIDNVIHLDEIERWTTHLERATSSAR